MALMPGPIYYRGRFLGNHPSLSSDGGKLQQLQSMKDGEEGTDGENGGSRILPSMNNPRALSGFWTKIFIPAAEGCKGRGRDVGR